MQQEAQLLGVTRYDIQQMFEEALKQFKSAKTRIMYLDASYLYTFDKSDYHYIQKFTDLIRVSSSRIIQWHTFLERWHQGESCFVLDRRIKPLQIERTLDRVPNEFLEKIAQAMAGQGDFAPMKFHAIGDGAAAGSDALPGDTTLVSEIDRIDVTQDLGGGAMTVNGSTFFNIGNHAITIPSGDYTETGIFDNEKPGTESTFNDTMGDHAIFPTAVNHLSGQNAIGSTTVIYQCSS